MRVTATLFAVGALVAVVVQKVVLQPLFWRIEPVALGAGLGLLTLVLAMAGPAAGYLWRFHPLRRRPATFALSPDGPAFVVPASSVYRGFLAISGLVLVGNLLPIERVPDADRVRLSSIPFVVPIMFGLGATVAVVTLAILWLPNPSLRLTPAGVALRYPVGGRREVGWDDLLPGGPTGTSRWVLTLNYRASNRLVLQPILYDVDHAFLASVIRHYAERPEHRRDIGTSHELERLESGYARSRQQQPVAQSA